MPSIVETLEQEEMWYGQDGFPYRVAEMELSHVTNVLAFLRRRADDLLARRRWYESVMERRYGKCDDGCWHPTGIEDSAAAWLERRPLVKALKYELVLRDTVDGEVVDVKGELT